MALQAGMGVTRLLVIVGAGYTGTIMLKNGKFSDVLAEFQNLVKKYEKAGEDGESDLSAQVRRLAEEMRRLAHNRPITVLNGNSGQNAFSSLVVPAAAFGALGYGYMWWKAAKKHLTQRIENLDGKLNEQVEMSRRIKNDVTNVRGDLSQINCRLDVMHLTLDDLNGKLLMLGAKQDDANVGIDYLCYIASGKKLPMTERLQERLRACGNLAPSLMGLKDLGLLEFGIGNNRLSITDVSWDGMEKGSDLKPRSLTRSTQLHK